jgi:hypothetical protein
MSNSEEETSTDRLGIDDEQLPEDLQPGDDNPLAGGLDDGETVDGLLDGGKRADQMSDGGQDDPADHQADESDDSDTESGSGAS